ncbi:kinase-like domain-containing protein [Rhizophagus irregularis DAOM 181602=DAOM 197198]|nr:kinase-like domain-containing protein [Rhizophagus irregularis DAOM 181602=DAOM 197198]
MATIRREIVQAAINRAFALANPNIQNNLEKQHFGLMDVMLNENVESANKSWFDEGLSHLHISSKSFLIVQCYGLTQNPFNGNYMIVMNQYKELMEQCWDANPMIRPDISTLFNKISNIYRCASSSNWNISSRVYNFENLPEPKNATKEEQDAYHSIQFDFDLQDGLIIEEQSNKRSYFDDDEKDLASNSNKKVNSNNNEEIQYHEIGYQYTQRNYATKLFKHQD